jgi:ATP/maltotriose-dependent transcriptional regulator MalT
MPERFTLVLDDYHLITAQPIHDGLALLLDHLPPQLPPNGFSSPLLERARSGVARQKRSKT